MARAEVSREMAVDSVAVEVTVAIEVTIDRVSEPPTQDSVTSLFVLDACFKCKYPLLQTNE